MHRSVSHAVAVILGGLVSLPAAAFDLRWRELGIGFDSELTAGAARRAGERDPALIGLANGGTAYSTNNDDGNLAFERGDLVNAVSKITSDLTLRAGAFGVFARGNYFYNPVLQDPELFDTADYLPNIGKEFGLDELDRKHDTVRAQTGDGAALLDAYLFGRMQLLGFPVGLRVGRQTVDWGETLHLPNGLDSLLATDLNRQRLPGHTFEEIVVPAGTAWAAAGLTRTTRLEGFYQYEWKPAVPDAAGTFWSVNDFIGAGGTQFNLGYGRVGENTIAGITTVPDALGVACLPLPPLPLLSQDCVPLGSTIPRAPDVPARDGGQYGGALKFRIPALNHMDLSLSTARYHSRLPVLSMISRSLPAILPDQADTAAYFAEYPENIRMHGLGFSTAVNRLDAVIHGEYSHTRNQPLAIDDIELLLAALGQASQIHPLAGATLGNLYLPGWRRHNVSQWGVGATHALISVLGADLVELELEAGGVHVHDLPPPGVLRYEAPGTHTPGDAATAAALNLPQQTGGYATASSWGYRVAVRPTFFNVLGPFSLEPALRFDHDLEGITPAPLSSYVAGRRQFSAALALVYSDHWSFEFGYTEYFGGGAQNLLADRDFYEASLKVWF